MVFGLGRKAKNAEPAEPDEPLTAAESGAGEPGTSALRQDGPFDETEISSRDGFVDLGALLITPSEGLQLRLEVEEATQRVVAVTLDLNGSSLQLQAFAAPKTETLWDEIREQIGQWVGAQGGQVEEVEGAFGTELVAKLPAGLPDGSQGYRVARFIGVDGPRWFLRGVLGGPAALEKPAAEPLEALFRKVVVVRGDSPMPPRDLLQLRLPKDASATPPPAAPTLEEPERGPEITQIG